MNRPLAAGFLWAAVVLAVLYGYGNHRRASAFELPIPQQGDTLDVDAVMATFGVRLDEKAGAWLLG